MGDEYNPIASKVAIACPGKAKVSSDRVSPRVLRTNEAATRSFDLCFCPNLA